MWIFSGFLLPLIHLHHLGLWSVFFTISWHLLIKQQIDYWGKWSADKLIININFSCSPNTNIIQYIWAKVCVLCVCGMTDVFLALTLTFILEHVLICHFIIWLCFYPLRNYSSSSSSSSFLHVSPPAVFLCSGLLMLQIFIIYTRITNRLPEKIMVPGPNTRRTRMYCSQPIIWHPSLQ